MAPLVTVQKNDPHVILHCGFLGSTIIFEGDDTDIISFVLSLKPQTSTHDPHPVGNPPHVVL